MTDIVERARAAQHSILPQPELIKDLADEVERLRAATSLHHELVAALEELHAMVRGECPSLLNEDSGGNGRLDVDITDLLQKAKQGDKQ